MNKIKRIYLWPITGTEWSDVVPGLFKNCWNATTVSVRKTSTGPFERDGIGRCGTFGGTILRDTTMPRVSYTCVGFAVIGVPVVRARLMLIDDISLEMPTSLHNAIVRGRARIERYGEWRRTAVNGELSALDDYRGQCHT